MGMRCLLYIFCALMLLCLLPPVSMKAGAGDIHPQTGKDADLPPGATRCDLSVPIKIDLVQLDEARAGQPARFRVEIESDIDPDLVRDMWVEYEIPERIQRVANAANSPQRLSRTGRSRLELGLIVPDQDRYRIRARVFVQLSGGRTLSQTAVRWLNPDKRPPDSMVGRISRPDGSGIRVYRGVTVR